MNYEFIIMLFSPGPVTSSLYAKIFPMSVQLLINLPTQLTYPLWLQTFTQFSSSNHLEQSHFRKKISISLKPRQVSLYEQWWMQNVCHICQACYHQLMSIYVCTENTVNYNIRAIFINTFNMHSDTLNRKSKFQCFTVHFSIQ